MPVVETQSWLTYVLGAVREVALALDYWIYTIPLLIVLLGMAGLVGRGLGLHNLFRDDDQLFNRAQSWHPAAAGTAAPPSDWRPILASPAFWSGFGFMATFGLYWMVAHPEHLGHMTTVVALALAALVLLAANLRQLLRERADFDPMRRGSLARELARLAAGAALGIAVTLVARSLPGCLEPVAAHWSPFWRWLAEKSYAVPHAVFVGYVILRPNALPCTSIFSLIMTLLVVGAIYPDTWSNWIGLTVLIGIVAVAVLNGLPGKYNLPELDAATPKITFNPQGSPEGGSHAPLIAPVDALAAWKKSTGAEKPVLVLLATSGGAYRAGFWTSLLLDQLIKEGGPGGAWQDLHRNIRLLTGASGGMVASAYFVAMAAQGTLEQGITLKICDDTRESLRENERRRWPIARDSLSPVVHQMVRRDLPATLAPWSQSMDRGRKLDAQWSTLHRNFASFWQQERDGIVPSIILAPMLVETGALALFSNLDLLPIRKRSVPEPSQPGDENKTSVEVFRSFEGAHSKVSLATAVRLNASFPYVSPAISLPIWPERRPVDAGYYDNYGVDLLTAYLDDSDVFRWITANCAAVAVIQVRAFPSEQPTAPASGTARALQFLTGPPEGLFSARKASQMFRNDQQLVAAVKRYASAAGREFVRVFTFEANTDVSMSWYQRCDEMRAMHGLLRPPRADELQFEGPVLLPDSQARVVSRDEVRDWALGRFGTWDNLMDALQTNQPDALRSQYLHHRAKVAEEFEALATFWRNPTGPPQPRG